MEEKKVEHDDDESKNYNVEPSLVYCGTGLEIEVCHVFRTRRGELRSGNTKLLTHFLMTSKTHVFRVPLAAFWPNAAGKK